MKTKKKVISFPDANFFAQNEVKAKKRSSPALTPSLGHENIGGMLPDYWGGDTSLHGFAPMVMRGSKL